MSRRPEQSGSSRKPLPASMEEALAAGLSKGQYIARKKRAQKSRKKLQNAWAMYDWANSAYNLVITSTIFPAYYEGITGDGNPATLDDKVTLFGFSFVNTALYTYALAAAFLLVAIISPVLSSKADARGNKRVYLATFAAIGSFACMGLFFYDSSNLWLGLLLSVIACVGFWGSLVFYNSYLPEIATPAERDGVSARGFAYGYAGSVLLQLLCLLLVLNAKAIDITEEFASQVSFLLTGLWWIGFAQITLRRLPKGNSPLTGAPAAHSRGYSALRNVWRQIRQLPVLKRFLGAFFFYSMGVQTVMLAATLYGKSELQIPVDNLIISILLIQIIAIAGAWCIARLSAKIGNLPALCACIVVWIGICIVGYRLPASDVYAFYGLAAAVGFVMGGIQSLSRSTYSKMIPDQITDTTSFFSFFDVTEKLAIVTGMLTYGFIIEQTGSQRASVLALAGFFAVGLLLLLLARMRERKNIAVANEPSVQPVP